MFWVFSYGTVCLHWHFAPSAVILAVCSFSPGQTHPGVCDQSLQFVPEPPPEPGQCPIVTAWPATPTQPCCRAELTRAGGRRGVCAQSCQVDVSPWVPCTARAAGGAGGASTAGSGLNCTPESDPAILFWLLNSVYITNKRAIMGKPFYQYPVSMIWRLRAAGSQHRHKMLGRAFLCNLIL